MNWSLRYLKATTDYRLLYRKIINGRLIGFTDSDWAGDSADRKSQGGYIFERNGCGPISWQSRKQDLVATSILEAEYIACSEASREARWLIQLQNDINGNGKDSNDCAPPSINDCAPPPIRSNNQGALAIISTGVIKRRTKHIDVCYHNSRDLHTRGIVEFFYVNTDENTADLFTKPLVIQKHQKFTAAAGLRHF